MNPLDASIAIVGAGQAAARAAHALRSQGHAGSIAMVGAERHAPYERPPLSKAVLCDDVEPALDVLTAAQFRDCDLVFMPGVRARRLDAAQHALHLDDGRILRYGRCLLATGGRVRELQDLPQGMPRVHYLRSLDDARRLRGALAPGAHLAIVGGGFLGLEVAASALRRGMQATVVESSPALLGRFLPAEVSDWLTCTLRRAGARLALGRSVRAVRSDAEGVEIELDSHETVRADQVLAAIGLVPETGLARAAGLLLDEGNGGIVVDACGRTSDPDVFAAGDCASQFSVHLGRHVRIESWQNANAQAEAAAAGLLDRAPPSQAYPWFWTDQGPHNIQILGLAASDLDYVRRGDPDGGARAVWIGHRSGVPIHGIALNAGADLRALRPLFEERIAFDAEEFVAGTAPMRAWVKSAIASHVTRT